MNFPLLPLFLAIWVPTNDEIWEHGPEYEFELEVNMIAAMNMDNGTLLGTRMSGKLKCRPNPQNSLSLICKTENTNIIRIHPQGFHTSGLEVYKNISYAPIGLGRDQFQINFNKEGIENYILENTKRPSQAAVIDMIRLIANQLSIGADLEKQGFDNQFKKMENFTVGECETEFQVNRKPIEKREIRRKMKYKIISAMTEKQFDFSDKERIEIKKRRNIEKCSRRKEYYFGTRYTLGIVIRDVFNDLKSSFSQIVISKNNFTTETTNECEIFDLEGNHLGKVLDHMKLSLKDVQPAKEELLPIVKPKSFDILAGESVVISENHYKMLFDSS